MTAPLRSLSLRVRSTMRWLKRPKLVRRSPPPDWLAQGRGIATLEHKEAAAQHFANEGFLAPAALFTKAQCDLILRHIRLGAKPVLETGAKDLAAKDRFFLDLAGCPQILERLRLLLGEDVNLWGASLVERAPGAEHLFHTDIESASPEGGFATLWVGLENTTQASSLQLITRSHKLGRSLQEETHRQGFQRGQIDPLTMVNWARRSEMEAELVQPEMRDGDGLFFDGRLWHGSHNASDKTRTALLLQYVRQGVPVSLHEVGSAEWPFRMTNKSPTLLPVMRAGEPMRNQPLAAANLPSMPLVEPTTKDGSGFLPGPSGWATYPIFRGATPNTSILSSHASVLSPGHSPHEPHCHVEEEILIILDGEAEVLIATSPDPTGARVEHLTAGSFAYYPAYQFHTIRNVSDRPVTYLMYKWQAAPLESAKPLTTQIFDIKPIKFPASNRPIAMELLFEAPTGYLSKLHAHVTEIVPSGGYAAHSDAHDVGIVVFDGQVETLGSRLGPGGSTFSPGGTLHGMHNPGHRPARYLVFEFHR